MIRYKITKFIDDMRARCQRFIRGYAYIDIWNFDMWYEETIPKMLHHWAKHGMSHPPEYTPKEWEQILERMAETMELTKAETETDKSFISLEEENHRRDIAQQYIDEHFDLMKK